MKKQEFEEKVREWIDTHNRSLNYHLDKILAISDKVDRIAVTQRRLEKQVYMLQHPAVYIIPNDVVRFPDWDTAYHSPFVTDRDSNSFKTQCIIKIGDTIYREDCYVLRPEEDKGQ